MVKLIEIWALEAFTGPASSLVILDAIDPFRQALEAEVKAFGAPGFRRRSGWSR
ncbi:hypothetical protein [Methylobacterium sp. Leaf456]|uniref:hypothetical protein n=1 Tax=Methylobacterium sp. Leaf456 TaxID=1736382 RepID=UPI001AECEBB6|nr:hypothetical protein [Methylobacterium sp. Leaf456]